MKISLLIKGLLISIVLGFTTASTHPAENDSLNAKAMVLQSYRMDTNRDGVFDLIEILGKKDQLTSIRVLSGIDKSLMYENKQIFNNSYNGCIYSSFDNIAVSKNNFTLEYRTCADRSEVGHRYSTFKTEKNKEPVLIQDDYLLYPKAETPDDFVPKQVNCLTKKKIKFSEYYGRCG
ncbi:hypothetical protein [Acinetobacter higginsii]|uniref:hypothetical protein n=1 Tax=Acinetobacter higginsii TaxID=70347 RepID=UPI001F4A8A00|nr:hypothetical protein [Acinetobacter higginsii]MCH7304840.1 hypothetical protein [Acinetobacter higginsii]MDO3664057.1 hypothetical protein [Acinetobacter higginsii]